MAIPLFILGATIIRTAAPSIIRALTKQGAKKIAKPTAKQIKKAVSPNKAPKKIQDAIKPKPTGTAGRKARRSQPTKTATDAARKKQTQQLKQGNGARKAQPPKKKPTTTATKKPTKKPDPKKKPTTTTKPDTGLTPGKVGGVLGGTALTLSGAKLLGDADKKARADRTDRQSGASRTARPSGRTDSETVGKEQKERQAKLPPREGMGGKATVSPDQKSRQATLPRDSREDQIGVKIARMLGDKRSVDKMISDREESEKMEEEMNLRRGGSVSKKYGAREGGFTKRGGMYKKGY